MNDQLTLILALIGLGSSLFLIWIADRQQRKSDLPGGRVIYADTTRWGTVFEPLYDPDLNLTGKPDYLVQRKEGVIPVEVKSSWLPAGPYDSHLLQLAVYCYLVEKQFGVRPPYGILRYPNKTFQIDYSKRLENQMLDTLADLRLNEQETSLDRDHNDPARCAGCGYRAKCNQALPG